MKAVRDTIPTPHPSCSETIPATQEGSYGHQPPHPTPAPIPEVSICSVLLPWAFLKALLLECSRLLGTEQHRWSTEGLEVLPKDVALMGSPNHEC